MSEQQSLDEISAETPRRLDLGPRSLELPKGWSKSEFGEIFTHQRGVNYSSDNYVEEGEGMIFLTLNAISPGGGLKKDSLKFYNDDISDKKKVSAGDVLMANTDLNQDGEIIGYPVRVPSFDSNASNCFSHHLLKIEQEKEVYQGHFLEYLLSAKYVHDRMIAFSCGSTVLNLNTDLLDSLELPVPPLSEQRKIATILYTVDRAIEKSKEIKTQLERTHNGLIQDFLTHGIQDSETIDTGTKLGEVPSHWEFVTIENILSDEDYSFTDGARYSLSSDEIQDSGDARAILLEEVKEGEFDDSNPKFATEEKYNEITHRAIYPGEVVVAKMAEPVARACIVPDTYEKYLLGCADVVRIVPNEEIEDRFLCCVE